MYILPAIDLRNNQVVRLSQGDYNQTKIYSSDVSATAQDFVDAGATHLHIVD
ncbi:MAG: HisA/HisF-related TIM barrel protein, partial [Eubacteriales bacterium]